MTRWWERTEKASISSRLMPKRQARFSAVWPIKRPTTGSVRPFIRPITGLSSTLGRSLRKCPAFWPRVFICIMPANHNTMASL